MASSEAEALLGAGGARVLSGGQWPPVGSPPCVVGRGAPRPVCVSCAASLLPRNYLARCVVLSCKSFWLGTGTCLLLAANETLSQRIRKL